MPALFAVLALASVGALAITQGLRQGRDVITGVRLAEALRPEDDEPARIRFRLNRGDERARVEVIDRDDDEVRTLAEGPLAEGRHTYRWDGTDEAGEPAPRGRYRVRVQLGDQDREIVVPGTIRVRPGSG